MLQVMMSPSYVDVGLPRQELYGVGGEKERERDLYLGDRWNKSEQCWETMASQDHLLSYIFLFSHLQCGLRPGLWQNFNRAGAQSREQPCPNLKHNTVIAPSP